MGYTTYFDGSVILDPPLNEEQRDYINKFSASRRMHRTKGPYYVDGHSEFYIENDPDTDIIDHNKPDPSQPGLWCQWVVSDDGAYLEWDGGEKFYCADLWMSYLIDHFLGDNPKANGHPLVPDFGTGRMCNGRIFADGEEPSDFWQIVVEDNAVSIAEGYVSYGDPSPLFFMLPLVGG